MCSQQLKGEQAVTPYGTLALYRIVFPRRPSNVSTLAARLSRREGRFRLVPQGGTSCAVGEEAAAALGTTGTPRDAEPTSSPIVACECHGSRITSRERGQNAVTSLCSESKRAGGKSANAEWRASLASVPPTRL